MARLHRAAVPMALAYGITDQRVPYCPLHSKYCVIDDYIVLEGSFNWYNTSVFSHDLLVIAARPALPAPTCTSSSRSCVSSASLPYRLRFRAFERNAGNLEKDAVSSLFLRNALSRRFPPCPTRTPILKTSPRGRRNHPKPRKTPGKPPQGPNWRSVWWYIPLTFLALWAWQDAFHEMSVKTIPYSQFKQYLAAGQVADCKIEETEITGQIVPKQVPPVAPSAAKSEEPKPAVAQRNSSPPASSGKSAASAVAGHTGETKPPVPP